MYLFIYFIFWLIFSYDDGDNEPDFEDRVKFYVFSALANRISNRVNFSV